MIVMTDAHAIMDMLRRRTPGYSLDAPLYTSAAAHDLDMDLIFHRHWIFVGVTPDVPEPGDVMTVEVGQSSVLIICGEDQEIRAFHNVCRHRGARLLSGPKGTVGNIVCSYHGWTYGETGELLFAEHMGPDFDRSCHGLKPVHLRTLAGLIFICLADDAPDDFDRMAQDIAPYIAPHDLTNAKVAHSWDLIEDGNWKLTMENNRECYHCAGNHPELTVPLQEYGFGFSPDELDDYRKADVAKYQDELDVAYARWAAMGLPSEELENLAAPTGYRTQRLVLMGAGESHTLDTRRACNKLLGSFTDARLGGLSLWTHPNSWHHFMADHAVTFMCMPLGPDRTLVRTKWLVHKDAVEGVDYDLENLTRVWTMTNRQDADLVALAHSGIAQPAYEAGPYSQFTESFVESFCQWYGARIAAGLGQSLTLVDETVAAE
ncbi:aromatic ring-hydroxylating dioxygenase subunit alpha [Breoghania sp.]|uniref:aromatic ring-hydroxylating oxygenase subunit alpha n=1 Tax=Breoghania sp. TaxID=2065378 RepID=UPI002AA66AAC|nr:aromatic ring-hydroxylating dioxygenase subunit alpha [Breoghania sp.]